MEVDRWQLKRIGTDESKYTYDLVEDVEYTIGRYRDNAIILPSLVVSRRHCRVLKDRTSLSIIDNGSENGTFINKIQIEKPNVPHTLKAGDVVGIGAPSHEDGTTFEFKVKHFPPRRDQVSQCNVPNEPEPRLARSSNAVQKGLQENGCSEGLSRGDTLIETRGANSPRHKEPAANTVDVSIQISQASAADVPMRKVQPSAAAEPISKSCASDNVLPMPGCRPSVVDVTKSKTWTQKSVPTVVHSPRTSALADNQPVSKAPVSSESASTAYGSRSAKLPISKASDLSDSKSPMQKSRLGKRKQVQESLEMNASSDSSTKRSRQESAKATLNGFAVRVVQDCANVVQSPNEVGVPRISHNGSKKQENVGNISERCVINDIECIEISDSDSEKMDAKAVNIKVKKKQDVPSGIHEAVPFIEAVKMSHQTNKLVDLSANDVTLQFVKTEKLDFEDEKVAGEQSGASNVKRLSPISAPAEDRMLTLNPAINFVKSEPEDIEPMGCDGKNENLNDSFMDMIDRMAGKSDLENEDLEKSQYSMQEIEYIIITDDEDDDIFPASQLFSDSHSFLKLKQEPDMSDSNESVLQNVEDDVDGNESPCGFEGSVAEEDEDSSDGWYEKLSQSKSRKNVPLKVSKIEKVLNRADKPKSWEHTEVSSDSDSSDSIIPRRSFHTKPRIKVIASDTSTDGEKNPAAPTLKEARFRKDSGSIVSEERPVPASRLSAPIEQSDSDSDSCAFKAGPSRGQKDLSKIQDIERSRLERLEKLKPVVIDAFPLRPGQRQRGIGTRDDTRPVQKKTRETKVDGKNLELIQQGKKRIEEQQRKKLDEENAAHLLQKQCADHEVPVIVGKRRISSVKSWHPKETVKEIAEETRKKKSKSKSKADKAENLKILRNERLKEIAAKAKAEKLKEAADAGVGKKVYQKPLIKITENNRGAFLVEKVTGSSPTLPKSIKTLPKISDLAPIPKLRPSVPLTNGHSSSAHPLSETISTHSATTKTPLVLKELSRRNSAPSTSVVNRGRRSDSVLSEPGTSKMASESRGSAPPEKSKVLCNDDVDLGCSKASSMEQDENRLAKSAVGGLLKSCLSLPFVKKVKKKISWNDRNLCEVKVFERYISQIVPQPVGNAKDIPPPNDYREQNRHATCPNLYETICNVCSWNTEWLTQQVANGPPPPVIDKKSQIPMLTQFSSYADYCQVVRPLMVLDLWASIWKDNIENKNREPFLIGLDRVTCSKKYITNNKHLDSVQCHGLLTAEDNRLNRHPRVGDLVLFELVLEKDEATGQPKRAPPGVSNVAPITASRVVRISFAYVIDVRKIPFTDKSIGHIGLFAKIQNARFQVFLHLLTKRRECVICFHSITRLRVVSSIRSPLRSFEAIGYLERSQLCNFILNPVKQDYSLPEVNMSETLSCDVPSRGRLNDTQKAAVLKTSKACLMDEPKICLIQGPPGTGKSLVIVNLIFHVLQSCKAVQKQKILFCAPSNAAVDEIVMRLLGVQEYMEEHRQFKIVRIGNPQRMDPAVRRVSLDELSAQRLRNRRGFESLDSVTLELNTLQAKCMKVQLELEYARENNRDTVALSTKLANYQQNIKNITMGHGIEKSPHEKYMERTEAERLILDEANVIAVTLASSASSIMEKLASYGMSQFQCCIVDEASQCSEPDCLLPLMQGLQTLVLVGDPQQLPATTHSQMAKTLGFGQSLLSRLSRCFTDENVNPIQLLTQQYRMHPEILRWPNGKFYENKLITPIEFNRASPLRPYRICEHDFKQSSSELSNHKEAELVVQLVRCVLNVLVEHKMLLNIGIITPYSKQRVKIRGMLKQFGLDETVTVNTIDGYQGKERDVIIMSCVRTQGTGFMSDAQRLNVSLTRARFSMIICANFKSLENDPLWKSLKEDGSVRAACFQLLPRHMQNSRTLESELLLY